MRTKIIFDTDVIGDDILAVISGAGIKSLEFCGVTTYGRRIGSRERASIAAGVLDAVGMGSVPVAAGVDVPLLKKPRDGCIKCDHPIMEFREEYTGCPKTNDEFEKRIERRPAYQFICDVVKEYPKEITLVCTGPLTNLALAIQCMPGIVDMVKDVVIMGGAAWCAGNVSPVAESNIFADPEAAELVFRKMRAITMVGLDVTLQVRVVYSDIANKLAERSGLLWDMYRGIIESCIEAQIDLGAPASMPLHDPLALLVAVDPTLVDTLKCVVAVETCGKHTDGQTVCYPLSNYSNDEGRAIVRVAHSVDIERSIEAYLDSLVLVND